MADINHRIGVAAPIAEVSRSLTTIEGLASWWTEETTGDPSVGGTIAFRFDGAPLPNGFDMRVVEATPEKLVVWEVLDGPEEWVGTRLRFELGENEGFTIVRFTHEGWPEVSDFLAHCTTKWATFLVSLKQRHETGVGAPSPHDLRLGDWH